MRRSLEGSLEDLVLIDELLGLLLGEDLDRARHGGGPAVPGLGHQLLEHRAQSLLHLVVPTAHHGDRRTLSDHDLELPVIEEALVQLGPHLGPDPIVGRFRPRGWCSVGWIPVVLLDRVSDRLPQQEGDHAARTGALAQKNG